MSDGLWHHENQTETFVGVDETAGRFAEVRLLKCIKCDRLWLEYHVEYEQYSESGRWARGIITEEQAAAMTPEKAPAYLNSLDWYIYGGSYFRHAGQRGSGEISWW